MTVERYGMRGALRGKPATTSVSAAAIGRIAPVWTACSTSRRLQVISRSARRRSSAATASIDPATTVVRGALRAAIVTPGASIASISRGDSATTVIAPGGSEAMRRARAAASARASSGANTPAATAAASSPRLWPRTIEGTTPSEAQSAWSASSSARSAGCATIVVESGDRSRSAARPI